MKRGILKTEFILSGKEFSHECGYEYVRALFEVLANTSYYHTEVYSIGRVSIVVYDSFMNKMIRYEYTEKEG